MPALRPLITALFAIATLTIAHAQTATTPATMPAPTPATPAASRAKLKAFIAMQTDPVMMQYVHPHRLRQGRESDIMPSGAMGANAQWERKERPARYIEEQRRGADFFAEPGFALDDAAAIKKGLAIMQYGFDWQAEDGAFPGCPDEFHSAIFFLESAARTLVLLRAHDETKCTQQLAQWKPKLETLARRLLKPETAGAQRNLDDAEKFTHRDYIYAAAFAMLPEVIDLPGAREAAARHAARALARQLGDGTNPERGGFDIGYQAAGLLFAGRYYYFCDDETMRKRVAAMFDKALAALRANLADDGQALVEKSTRIGREKDREGVPKKANYAVIANVYATGARITGRAAHAIFAETVGRNQVRE